MKNFSYRFYKENSAINNFLLGASLFALAVSVTKGVMTGNLYGPFMTLAFAVSVFVTAWYRYQGFARGLVCYGMAGIAIYLDQTAASGVAFPFLIASFAFLYRQDILSTRKIQWAIVFFGLYAVFALLAIVLWGDHDLSYATFLIPQLGVVAIVIILFREKFLFSSKKTLTLAEKLTRKESEYVLAFVSGQTFKEIAHEAGVSPSTVRNMINRAVGKLGLVDTKDLVRLSERFTLC